MPTIQSLMRSKKLGLALLSFAVWTMLFSWKFAILIMGSIGFHEYGHIVAMRYCGLRTKGFYFLPLAGGVSVTIDPYRSYEDWSIVAIMGPVFGMLLAAAMVALYYATGLPIFASAAVFMCGVNAFNLLPIYPLDGALLLRTVVSSIRKDIWYPILLVCGVLGGLAALYFRQMFVVFVAGVGIYLLYKENSQMASRYRNMKRMNIQWILITIGYHAGVFAVLLYMFGLMYTVHGSGVWSNFGR
jgi:Zn-dependent protease